MTKWQRILLIPCLSPLIAVMIISAFNLDQSIRLRILVWQSPSISLGAWIALGGGTGALMGIAKNTLLQKSRISLRRTIHRSYQPNHEVNESNWEIPLNDEYYQEEQYPNESNTLSPERSLNDPLPTVAVNFRVIKRSQESIKKQNFRHWKNHTEEEQTSDLPQTHSDKEITDNGWGNEHSDSW